MIERPDRGSFAGAWVFPGGKLDAADRRRCRTSPRRRTPAARPCARRWRRRGSSVDPDALVTLSCWDPPPGLALRIRTWFFAAAGAGGALALSADEAVAAEWLRPPTRWRATAAASSRCIRRRG